MFSLVGCKPAAENGGSANTAAGGAATGNEILIGHFASLTGGTATFGTDTDQGVQLAVKELNAAGGWNGKHFRVDTQDDASKPEEAKTVVTSFAGNKDIVAVLGEVASTRSMIAAPVLEKAGIPMISPASTNPEVTKLGKHIFRVCYIDPFQGYVVSKFAHDDLKATKAAILLDQKNDYSVGLAKVIREEFTKMGGQIVVEQSFKEGDSQFRAQLTTIKDAKPDVVFVPGYYAEAGPIARQARELGITAPLVGADGWDSQQLVKGAGGAGGALEGCYFANHYSKDDKAANVQAFVKAYKADNKGNDPSALAALGYDAMKILADAIKRANSTDREKITEALAATRDFPGVTGKISIDADHNARKSAVIIQIKGDQFLYRRTIQPPDAAK